MTEKSIYEIHTGREGDYSPQWNECDEIDLNAAIEAAATLKQTTIDEIKILLTNGHEVAYDETSNYYYTHDMKRIRVRPAPRPQPIMVKCSCGHTIPKTSVMSASMGSSCPNCYDRMSM
jgi:hypothetical protein